MDDFDPDAYISDNVQGGGNSSPPQDNFDPDQYIQSFDPDQYIRGIQQQPQAESLPMTMGREVANEALPSAGGWVGAGAGAELGAMAAPFLGPAGVAAPFVGALGGAMLGGAAVQKAQQWFKESVGLDDSSQRALNAQEHPWAAGATDVATNLMGGGLNKGATLAARGISGGLMGGIEVGSEAAQDQPWDPARIASSFAGGALLPGQNALGRKLTGAGESAVNAIKGRVAGRPNVNANPEAADAQQQVQPQPQSANANTLGVANTPAPPNENQPTTGAAGKGDAPGSISVGSERDYGVRASPNDTATVTTGQISPDIQAAAEAASKGFTPTESPLGNNDAGTIATRAPAPGGAKPMAKLAPEITSSQGGIKLPPQTPNIPLDTGAPKGGPGVDWKNLSPQNPAPRLKPKQAGAQTTTVTSRPTAAPATPVNKRSTIASASDANRQGIEKNPDGTFSVKDAQGNVVSTHDLLGQAYIARNKMLREKPVATTVTKRSTKPSLEDQLAAARAENARLKGENPVAVSTQESAPAKNEPAPATVHGPNEPVNSGEKSAPKATENRTDAAMRKHNEQMAARIGKLKPAANEPASAPNQTSTQPRGPLAREVAPQHMPWYDKGYSGEPRGGNQAEQAAWDRGANDKMNADRDAWVNRRQGLEREGGLKVTSREELGKDWDAKNETSSAPESPKSEPPKAQVPEPVYKLLKASPKETNTNPTQGQVEGDNFKKAGGRVFKRNFTVDVPRGEMRRGVDAQGNPYENRMEADYGSFKGTKGADSTAATKDKPAKVRNVDGYIDGTGDRHFIIDQRSLESGKFDEHKVIAYTKDADRAQQIYHNGFADNQGPDRLGTITEVSQKEAEDWLAKPGMKRKPYNEEAWHDRPPRTVTVTAPKEDNLVIKGVFDENGKPVRADTVGEARAAEAKIARVNATYEKLIEHPALSPERLDKAETDPKVRQDVRAALTKFAAETSGGYKGPRFNRPDGFAVRDAIVNYNNAPTKNRWNTLLSDLILLRAGDKENVRQRRRIAADIGLNRRIAPEEVPDAELHRLTGGEETEGPEHNEATINGEHSRDTTGPEPFTGLKAEPGNSKAGRVLERTNPEPPAFSGLKATPVKEGSGKNLDEALNVRNSDGHVAMMFNREGKNARIAKAEPRREKDKGRSLGADAIAEANRLLREKGKLTPADLTRLGPKKGLFDRMTRDEDGTPDHSLRGDILNLLKDKKGGGKLPSWRDIKKALAPAGNAILKAETAVGAGRDALIRKLGGDPTLTEHEFARVRQPKRESEKVGYRLDAKYNEMRKTDQAEAIDLMQTVEGGRELAKERGLGEGPNNSIEKALRRIYDARDHLSATGSDKQLKSLDPKEQNFYHVYMEPWFNKVDQMADAIRAINPEKLGPQVMNHISRIVHGDMGADYGDIFGAQRDPLTGVSGISTARKGPALDRKFQALTNDNTGERHIIALNDDGFTIHRDGNKAWKVNVPDFEYQPGEKLTVNAKGGGQNVFTMGDATTNEIEQHARGDGGKRMKYYHNPLASAANGEYYLGRMLRHMQFENDLKNSPEFRKFATTNAEDGIANGWEQTNHPNFRHWYMHPDLKNVLDHFADPGIPALKSFRGLAKAVVKTIFWNPLVHPENVGVHSIIQQGWDLLKPSAYYSHMVDLPRAVKEVASNGDLYKQAMKMGAGLVHGGIVSNGTMMKIMEKAGEDMSKHPAKWGPISKKLGVKLPDLYNSYMDAMQHAMWIGSDVMLMKAYMQKMRMTGKPLSKSLIADVERHIPNYRSYPTINPFPFESWNQKFGRGLSNVLNEPTITAFNPYHTGVFNGYAALVKDLIGKNATMGDRVEAAGHWLAIGALAYGLYPLLDKAARTVTGNDQAEQRRRGSLTIPHALVKERGDPTTAMRDAVTISPVLSTLTQQMANKDWAGRAIREPGDSAAKQAVETAAHAARNLFSPYGTVSNWLNNDQQGVGKGARDTLMDIKNPSTAAQKFENTRDKKAAKAAITRSKHPRDPVEGYLLDKLR